MSSTKNTEVTQKKKRMPAKPFTGPDDPRINKKGRPLKEYSLTQALQEYVSAKDEKGQDRREMIAQQLVKMAMKGDTAAMKYVFDRVDGKLLEKVMADLTADIKVTFIE